MKKKEIPSVRRATSGDAGLLAELGARTFADTFASDNTPEDMEAYLSENFTPERQAAELSDPSSIFLIAEIDGEAAGYARLQSGRPPSCVAAPDPLELARLYVDQAWIGRGVGEALMRACVGEAERAGRKAIWLGVWERNERAKSFYIKWGFRKVGEQTFKLGSDLQNDWVMERPL
ncbi:MAG TPA: GNAT family N-acetyltransferase [Blastocatellia bacterium]|nr:GNAT family N-acetyltransferase [Blastocatellia bacterium]